MKTFHSQRLTTTGISLVREQTEAMRRELIGNVAHELRTPLTNIKGYMEGLIDGVLPPEPETYQLVYREADRLQRLVSDLQELSRIEAGATGKGNRIKRPPFMQTVAESVGLEDRRFARLGQNRWNAVSTTPTTSAGCVAFIFATAAIYSNV